MLQVRLLLALALLLTLTPGTSSATPWAPPQDGKTFEELEEDLRDEDGRKRRVAVRRLSELATEEAFELILAALADEDPQVADEAQLRLAEVPSQEWWDEHAFGKAGLKSKNVVVRRRVAEAWGRAIGSRESQRNMTVTEPVRIPKKVLDKGLKDRDATVARYLFWSIERGGLMETKVSDMRSELATAAFRKAKDPLVRGAALLSLSSSALFRFDDEADSRELLESALEDKQAAVRAAGVLATGDWRSDVPYAVQYGAAALRDEHIAVRRAAMRVLSEVGSPECMELLVDALVDSEDRVDQIWLVEVLRAASGRRYGANPEAWSGWLRDLPADWQALTTKNRSVSNSRAGGNFQEDEPAPRVTVAELAGLPIQSERVSVLIDMSGSMWTTRDDGRRPKDLVELELNRFLSSLPESAKFNLIPYASEPEPWKGELQKAKPKTLKGALESFERLDLRGKGNVWSAIEVALEDEEVDTIVILSDGAPSGGEHWNMELLVDLLLERNRFQQVAFSSILTEPSNGLVRHWQRLADESRGHCRVVEYEDLGSSDDGDE